MKHYHHINTQYSVARPQTAHGAAQAAHGAAQLPVARPQVAHGAAQVAHGAALLPVARPQAAHGAAQQPDHSAGCLWPVVLPTGDTLKPHSSSLWRPTMLLCSNNAALQLCSSPQTGGVEQQRASSQTSTGCRPLHIRGWNQLSGSP